MASITEEQAVERLTTLRLIQESNRYEEPLLMAIRGLEKLEKIEQIIHEYNNGDDMEYEYLAKIRDVLDKE